MTSVEIRKQFLACRQYKLRDEKEKAEPFAFIGPRVSNAKGMNVCVRASDWYLSSFRSAAPSVAAPAVDDVA